METASTDLSSISTDDAGHALWLLADGTAAIRPGLFIEHLMQAIAHADPLNRLALSAAFPGPAAAVSLGKQIGGLDVLTAIAKGCTAELVRADRSRATTVGPLTTT